MEYFLKKLYMIGFVTKLGFEKPKSVHKSQWGGQNFEKLLL
jgi:hypothetical protein